MKKQLYYTSTKHYLRKPILLYEFNKGTAMSKKQLAFVIVLGVVVGTMQAKDSDYNETEQVVKSVHDTVVPVDKATSSVEQPETTIKPVDVKSTEPKPIPVAQDSDSDMGDSDIQNLLQEMIDSGVSANEFKPEPMPWWKEWFMRVGDVVIPRYYAVKHYLNDRYQSFKQSMNNLMARMVVRKAVEQQVEQKQQENAQNGKTPAA